MKIYKFKDLSICSKHSHTFQIVEENRIWSASPDSLNDPEEFRFNLDYLPSEKTAILVSEFLANYGNLPVHMTAPYVMLQNKLPEIMPKEVQGIIETCRKSFGVISFAKTLGEPLLWERYGGDGNGVAIEFELPDSAVGTTFHEVDYVSARNFHVDLFLESCIGSSEAIFRKMLCTKTRSWCPENEIRFLSKRPDVNIVLEFTVTAVWLGSNVDEKVRDRLSTKCSSRDIPLHEFAT